MVQGFKVVLVATMTVLLSGCGTINSAPSIGNSIVNDSMELNEAYGEASTAVIVKNILRARDRWPTTYTTLSKITSTPTLTRASDINLNPLGLGNPSGPLQGTTSKFSNSSRALNSYDVAPFTHGANDNGGPLVAIEGDAFEKYFKRWPRDVALFVLVGGIHANDKFVGNDGEKTQEFVNDIAHAFHLSQAQYNRFNVKKHLDIKKVEKDGSENYYLYMKQDSNLTLSHQQLKMMYQVEPRSIDSMIYYLGETLRSEQYPVTVDCYVNTPRGYKEMPVKAKLIDIPTINEARPVSHAVKLNHAGRTYVALPNATQVTEVEGCFRDRSSTVVSLLSQLLIVSQNPKAFEGQSNLIINN